MPPSSFKMLNRDLRYLLTLRLDPYILPRKASMVQIQDNRNSILSVHNDSRDLDAQLQDVLVLLNNISMDCEPPRTERPWTQQKENTGRMPCAKTGCHAQRVDDTCQQSNLRGLPKLRAIYQRKLC
jgi:hypothetical protein